MGISKEQRKALINKAVDLAYDGMGTSDIEKRLYDYSQGLFAGDESITFNEVFLAVKKAVLTVQAVLEEVKQDVL